LVKDSSLLSIIAVSEVTKVVQEIDSLNYATIETFIQLAGLYLLITLPLSALSKALERRFAYEN
jgi:polar amino acid transport system permease protein